MVCYDGAGHLVVRYQLDLAIMSGHSGGVGGARVDHLVEVAVVEVAVVEVEVACHLLSMFRAVKVLRCE